MKTAEERAGKVRRDGRSSSSGRCITAIVPR